jgi:hypothetical protein
MKRALVLLAACLLVYSFSGCTSCCRRVRSTICPGAWCGSRAPATAPMMAPIVATPVVATPQIVPQQQCIQPQYVQPQQIIQPQVMQPQQFVQPQMQMAAPQCVPCCPCPCPPVMCDPCGSPCDGFSSYGSCCGGDMTAAGYGSDCGCDGSYSGPVISGESQPSGNWQQDTRQPTDANTDPGPGT